MGPMKEGKIMFSDRVSICLCTSERDLCFFGHLRAWRQFFMKIPKCVILKSYLHCNETVKLLIWIKMGASFLAEAGRNLVSGLKMTLIPLSYAVVCPLELLCP